MPDLPFLVIHGALFWKLLLAALIAGTWLFASRFMSVRRAAGYAAASGFGWYLALYAVGHYAGPDDYERLDELSPFGDVAIGAAMPGSRDHAMHLLYQGTLDGLTHDDAGLRLGLGIDELSGRCTMSRLEQSLRLDDALEAARRCGSRDNVRWLLEATGRFAEAVQLVDPVASPRQAIRLYLDVGNWRAAAEVIDRLGARDASEPAYWARCFSLFLRAHAGDGAALGLLKADRLEQCQVMAALATGETVIRWSGPTSVARVAALTDDLGWETHQYNDYYVPELEVEGAAPWLAVFAADGDRPERQDYLRARRAAREILLGDLQAADARLAAKPESSDGRWLLLAARDQSALRAGRPPAVRDDADQLSEIRARSREQLQSYRLDYVYPQSCPLRAATRTAMKGDGAPLVQVFRRCSVYWIAAGAFPAILPQIDHGAEGLADVIRNYHESSHPTEPFQWVSEMAMHRDLSKLAGDTAEVERWQTVIARYAKLFEDKDRAIALAIWNSF